VVTVCQLVVGELQEQGAKVPQQVRELNETLTREGLVAFGEVDIVPEFESGLIGIAQANGFAGMQSNTLMFGWPNDEAGLAMLLRVTGAASKIHKSAILARLPKEEGLARHTRIDVWWGGLQHNGDLMLLLAHLLNLNPEWRAAGVHLRTIVDDEAAREPMSSKLKELVTEVRIDAETDVILKQPDQSVIDVMHRASRGADVVFLGLAIPEPGTELEYAQRLFELADGFTATILVRNNEPFAGELI
jgi:hypothetical protein